MAVSQSISLTQGTQSIENNTTQVTFKWTSTQTGESWNGYTKTAYYYVSINGGAETKYSVSYTLPQSTTKTIVNTTISVPHNSDGTGSISVRTWMDTGISAGVVQKSQSLTLTTIPRASTFDALSCSTSYFDGTLTYKYTPKSANFYNKMDVYIQTASDTFAGIKTIKLGVKATSQQTATLTLSSSELTTIYGKLPTATKGTLRFTLRTYSDSGYTTQIGNMVSKDISLTIPTSVKPTIGTITIDPVNITTVDGTSRNILVKDKNKFKIDVTGCSAGSGSTIKSYALSGPDLGYNYTGTSTSVSYENPNTISSTGELTYTVKLTDKRGRYATKTIKITCYDYSAPSFTSFSCYRCNSSGTADEKGSYIKYDLQVQYASVNSTNKSTVKIRYKKSTDSAWTYAANALTNSTTKSASAIIQNTSGTAITFDASSTYLIYAIVTDNYNTSANSSQTTIFGESRIFNVRPNGSGIAFGKMSETNNLFESRWPAKFDDDVEIVGDVTVPNVGGPILNGYSVGTLGPGKSIPSGDDLNNYTTAGVFQSQSSTITNALINCPHTGSGFKLIVEYLGHASYFRQVLIPRSTSCKYYVRYHQSGTWYDWKTFESSDAIDTAISNIDLSSVANLTIGSNQYFTNSKFGIDMTNSDIINANGIYFKDASDSAGESINFYNSDGYWDTLYAKNGLLKFHPNRATATTLGGYEIYDQSQFTFECGTCTLSSSSDKTITFKIAFASAPTVMLTPLTTASGVIPGKVKSVSTTGFTGIIGGSAVTSAKFAYFAFCALRKG